MARIIKSVSLDPDVSEWADKNIPERGLSDFVNEIIKKEMGTAQNDGSLESRKEAMRVAWEKTELAKAEWGVRRDSYIAALDEKIREADSEKAIIMEQLRKIEEETMNRDKIIEDALGPRVEELMAKVRENPELMGATYSETNTDFMEGFIVKGPNNRYLFGDSDLFGFIKRRLVAEKEGEHGGIA